MEIDIDQMSQIIKLFEDSALTEITVEQDNYRLTLRKEARGDRAGSGGEPVTGVSGKDRGGEALATEEEFEEDDDRFYITSPIVGTFYSSASPDDAPYVQVGDVVHEGETVCIVEAMKVMNEVDADKEGRVVEVCVHEGDPVEYGQQLYKLEPAENS
ncbi:MAG: acetyl-CoA carboxylase biotin carboxyl carrier protein [Candidatus Bipolaricaulota bacterium]